MDLEVWLKLNNARSLSPLVCARLLNRFGSPQAILNASVAELSALRVSPEAISELHKPDLRWVEQQLLWAAKPGQHILTLADERYPPFLKTIADPPPVLFVKGHPELLTKVQIALVGSRKPSPGGLRAARELAQALAQAGVVVTSGLALGIDGASHQGALAGGGFTIAVLGSGLGQVYPLRHRSLAEAVAEQGALVSEFGLNVPPLAMHFPRRNRIISGLSQGTCVIEAALNSGSLITAKLAAEQGREVFAVPGSIYNVQSQGCLLLIQEGAKLVREVGDILTEIKRTSPQSCIMSMPWPLELDSKRRQLLECIGFEPTAVDQIIQHSGYSAAQVTSLLLDLELGGYVCLAAGGYQRV